jgi:hypothetical protein
MRKFFHELNIGDTFRLKNSRNQVLEFTKVSETQATYTDSTGVVHRTFHPDELVLV